jgi:hypothetical protein
LLLNANSAIFQLYHENDADNFVGPLDGADTKLGEKNKTIIMFMFNIAYCVMRGELPFTSYPTIDHLQYGKCGAMINR